MRVKGSNKIVLKGWIRTRIVIKIKIIVENTKASKIETSVTDKNLIFFRKWRTITINAKTETNKKIPFLIPEIVNKITKAKGR